MADKKPVETDKQRRRRLFNALLENIDRQLDIDQKLKENMVKKVRNLSTSLKTGVDARLP